jgi:dienelactone hydrolase
MLHPYYDKLSTTDAVTDMILAVQELVTESSVDAESNGDHFLMGYSQGGWATLATLKAAEAIPDNKISVVAASCGAGAYDLTAMSEYVLGWRPPGTAVPAFFHLFEDHGRGYHRTAHNLFQRALCSRIPVAFNGNYTNTQVNDTLTDTIPNLVTDELRLNLATGAEFGSLRAAMSNNSIQAWNTSATIRFYHGTADQNVPPVQSELIYNQFTSLGLTPPAVTLIPIPGATHDSGLIPWGITTISWFDSIKK